MIDCCLAGQRFFERVADGGLSRRRPGLAIGSAKGLASDHEETVQPKTRLASSGSCALTWAEAASKLIPSEVIASTLP